MCYHVRIYDMGFAGYKVDTTGPHLFPTPSTPEERRAESLRTSLSRSRRLLNALILCNRFELFVTVTLTNDETGAPPARDAVVTACKKALRSLSRQSPTPVRYILVPEQSDDDELAPGRWHAHLLMTGLPPAALQEHHLTDKGLPGLFYRRMRVGKRCFSVKPFARYGYCFAESIDQCQDSLERLAQYLTKTMHPHTCHEPVKGQRRIISSHGLLRPTPVFSGRVSEDIYWQMHRQETVENLQNVCPSFYLPRSFSFDLLQ